MKLRQIQFVCAIARTRSFSQAAAECNATQPTLSNAVAQLESQLNGKLFTRTTRQVDLTPFGRHMLPYLQAILIAQSEAASAAQSFHNPQQKLLRIGISPLVDMRMVTAVTQPFQRLHGPLDIFYKECLLDDLSERIANGAIDLAVLPERVVPDMLERQSFYSDPLVYLPQHGSALPAPLRLADIPQTPVILTGGGCGLNASLQALFKDDGAALPVYPGYAISYPVIQEWTWLGLGAGILPRAKIGDASGPVSQLLCNSGQPAQFDFVWCWRREAREIAHIASFLEHLRHRGPKLVQGLDRPVAV